MTEPPPDVYLNIFARDVEEATTDLSDVLSRHPSGSWPDPADDGGDSGPLLGADPGGADVSDGERPPGEPSPFWYTVGPWGLFYWQWAFVGTLGALLLVSDGGGRRRR